MKKKLQNFTILSAILFALITSKSYSQAYSVLQDFEAGGNGTDGCWRGYNQGAVPTTNDFFVVSNPSQSGLLSGGMYSCCGGAATNLPTYYISPVLLNGSHSVQFYVRQSSSFNENFLVGTVSDSIAGNFTSGFTKSTWPVTAGWEHVTTTITTNSTDKRIAFKVPAASLKTYYLDSIVISNSGNGSAGCNYVLSTSINNITADKNLISVYPNPFGNELTIKNIGNQMLEINLYDMTSRKLYQKKVINSGSLNTEELSKGIYMYEIRTDKGIIKTGKVVKEFDN